MFFRLPMALWLGPYGRVTLANMIQALISQCTPAHGAPNFFRMLSLITGVELRAFSDIQRIFLKFLGRDLAQRRTSSLLQEFWSAKEAVSALCLFQPKGPLARKYSALRRQFCSCSQSSLLSKLIDSSVKDILRVANGAGSQ